MTIVLLITPSVFGLIDFLHIAITKQRCPLWDKINLFLILCSFGFTIAITLITDLGIGILYALGWCITPCTFLGVIHDMEKSQKFINNI